MTFADDAGEYSIFAKNPHGEASASTSLLEEGTGILFFKTFFKNHFEKMCLALSASPYLCLQRNMKHI